MGMIGRLARASVFRPGRVRRIPAGIGRGLRLEVDPGAPLHTYLGTSELELASHIKRFAVLGNRCFDIGGNDAYYALVLARLTCADVVSFEFDAPSVARMQRNMSLNPELAAKIGIVETYVAHETCVSPKADTLDDMVSSGKVPEPDLMKIDVEGAETSVLSGARNLLESRRPHLVVETHSAQLESQCLELLRSVGYSPAIVDQRRWLREHRGTEQNRWIVAEGDSRVAA